MLTGTYKRVAAGLLMLPLLTGCSYSNELDRVLEAGELRVLTRNAATTYYEGPAGPTGLEYHLAKGFADELGVELKLITVSSVSDVVSELRQRRAHLAAAGLTITRERKNWARFTPPYQTISQQLVYRMGTVDRPDSISELNGTLEVLADSSHAERLRELRKAHPQLTWMENGELETEELLMRVSEKAADFTIADSNELRLNQRFYPELRAAFDISDPQGLAWAFPRGPDDSLYDAAVDYFERLKANGRLAQLIERHYGHVEKFDYVGTHMFMRHIRERLPDYRELLERAAAENDLDWRLLAAMAYQESHWDPKAVSPTGVRGFMMLTQATARFLGVQKRTDLWQSIEGGARYTRKLIELVPERIDHPDRVWMALAAYNIGYGHLNDARIITQRKGEDADVWKNVKKNLPLLRKRAWYENTKHGYARGNEAATYVGNIRSYYDILTWLTDQEKPSPEELQANFTIASPAL
ncbi:membrane-bound lytic murein transglycosylase MltF [Thiohalomonas denitrificans]|uniref:Membrane-bound lytic murein transglycosylase F n=1 Tax=Thiohalomonas denitrificans TaxID=415747 RepID=A0A1G5PJ32_9GAMM|nr:membrane-bound lytic murein transglycosylase MltF [Thiohalomonas denitrificans]SCZ49059.1 membrane-bound lytic murein transglycosylase F [Thiohalomonas denitrificans]